MDNAIKCNDSSYTYADGSANQYVFDKNSFEYIPVKPAESSTGHYSGGEYVKLKTPVEDFNKVVDLIRMAFADTASHVPNRDKGTGIIFIRQGKDVQSFILPMDSKHKKLIEGVLVGIKSK